jgi:hypothetical protein
LVFIFPFRDISIYLRTGEIKNAALPSAIRAVLEAEPYPRLQMLILDRESAGALAALAIRDEAADWEVRDVWDG